MIGPCLSSRPLSGSEYTDGQIYSIDDDSRVTLRVALLSEPWINLAESQSDLLRLMLSDEAKFVGTMVSVRRQQVQVTIIFKQMHAVYGGQAEFCVTLMDFHRFRRF